jgi:predicted acylesterase/phospholipase RssA
MLPVAVLPSRNPADLTFESFTGLLDTGATASWISAKVVTHFGLTSIGKGRVVVATEIRQLPLFVFRLGLIATHSGPMSLPYVFAETFGYQIKQADGFDVLLGMDVLSQTDFAMRRDGRWSLAFG